MTVLSELSLLAVLIPKATKPTEPPHKKRNEMSTHRFILEPYKGIATRHTCPECHKKRSFARYITQKGRLSFLLTWVAATMSKVVVITSLPRIFLRRIPKRMRHSQRMILFHIRREKCRSHYPLLI